MRVAGAADGGGAGLHVVGFCLGALERGRVLLVGGEVRGGEGEGEAAETGREDIREECAEEEEEEEEDDADETVTYALTAAVTCTSTGEADGDAVVVVGGGGGARGEQSCAVAVRLQAKEGGSVEAREVEAKALDSEASSRSPEPERVGSADTWVQRRSERPR